MQLSVRCRCNVRRTIDTSKVGAWRLRCKQCGDVLYDPSANAGPAQPVPQIATKRLGAPVDLGEDPFAPQDLKVPDLEDEDDGVEDSQFQRWLHGSAELQVMLSSDGSDAPRCERHRDRKVVAACTRCSLLLCKKCLDRIDDEFVCSECVALVASKADPKQGGLTAWFKRLFGGK